MKLLDRYVTRQLLITATFAVSILSVVLVLGDALKRLLSLLVDRNVPLEFILTFLAYILPFSLTFTIPWGFLTAVLLVFGKMSAENELIALRSSGVSIPRICASVFVLAMVCVGVCLWINLDVAPTAKVRMNDTAYEIATNNPLAMFASDKVIDEFPGKRIYVEQNDGPELHNILVYEMNEESVPMRVVYARRGVLKTDHEHNQLLLNLFDARFEERDEKDPSDLTRIRQGATVQETTFPISLEELQEKNRKRKGLGSMTLDELQKRIHQQQVAGENPDKKQSQGDLSEARTEVSKRFSLSLASLAFALIGVPLAITAHRKETSAGFVLSLAVAFVYFFFIILADTVHNNPKAHPELLVWTPNVLFMALGIWLFYRLSRR